jgi:pimeloyl-ACP methyl ester carboxylesterase
LILLQSQRFSCCYYKKCGTGFPIVLLHGFAETHSIWEKQIEILQNHFTLIIPDVPGSGHSQLCPETMTMELIADFVQEILIQENINQVFLFGHSMGGYATMVFVEKNSNYLKGFGLVHSSVFEDTEEKKKMRDQGIEILKKGGKTSFLKALISNIYSEHSKKSCVTDIENHLTNALAISSESLIAYYKAMKDRTDKIFTLQNTNLTAFIFSGKEDNAIPMETSLKQSSLALHTDFHLVNHIGHMGMYEAVDYLSLSIINYCNYTLQTKIA